MRRSALVLLCLFLLPLSLRAEPKPLKVLFLGDKGHHQPEARYRQLAGIMAARGIDITYVEKTSVLNPKTLGEYNGLIVYANINSLSDEQEKALLDFVAKGGGFIPIHCASYCFLNSQAYIDLVGAQFQKHGTGVFRTTIAEANHPIVKGFKGFESWDETYVHHKHNTKDRTVLEYRKEGDNREPWTWVRTHGKGNIFYTAWGHDERTWGHPGFQNLIERGIRWACNADLAMVPPYVDVPEMTTLNKDARPFEYLDANVPFYPPTGKRGDALKKMQLPLGPEESMKHIIHPTDFKLELFASEKDLGGKPICMNWDERGRLWVAVTIDYPNELQQEGKGRDRIIILQDTDGDGKADKTTVFAEKLSIPTSMAFANGGLIVHQAPHTLFLKDTNEDDVADERKVLFSGWHTGDTHAGPSNLNWGLDNRLYGIVGYSGFDGTIGGERQSFRTGFYRLNPDGTHFEFLRNTNNNSWGVGISEEGVLFGSTANGNPSVYMPIPNRYYEAVRGWSSTVLGGIAGNEKMHPITENVRQVDWHGRFTAAAGHALYTARTYPREYWNRAAFVTEPTGHVVSTFIIQGNGADFTSRNAWNLLASNDEWCSPIVAEVGPDGQVWIIDWYNFIVQHNPTPAGFKTGKGNAYETELRDKKHGRIYRLVYKDAKKTEPTTLQKATPEQLVDTLKNDNLFWRRHAQRLLVERGKKDVVPQLIQLAGQKNVDAIGLNPTVIHALWTLHGLGVLDGSDKEATKVAVTALKHQSPGVRRNAVQVLPRNSESVAAIVEAGLLNDADGQVRMMTILTLSEMPENTAAAEALLAIANKPENTDDRWLSDALTCATAAHSSPYLQALAGKKAVPSQKMLQSLAIVSEHYARGGPTTQVAALLQKLPGADGKIADVILTGLSKGWPKSKKVEMDEDTEKALATMLPRLSPGAKGQLLKLASQWGSKGLDKYSSEIAASMLSILKDEKAPEEQRIASARQLVEFRADDAELVETLLTQITPRTSPTLAVGIIDALSNSTADVGAALVQNLEGWSPSARQAAVRVLLSRPKLTGALLDALDKGKVQLGELSLDQKQALSTHPDKGIASQAKKLLERGGGLPNPDRQKVVEELLALTKKTGNAEAGKLVFKNQCAKCHTHSGEGAKVGPDLTGTAVHTKEHLLIDILDPSRNVEGNFRIYTVEAKDGRIFKGLLASETKTSIELIDAEGKKQVMLRENVDSLTASNMSLMPEGFEKQVAQEDIVNLLEFLTQRGKFLPLPLAKAATIISTRGMFFDPASELERLIFPDWSPKTFEGVPFQLVDPQGDKVPNVILLHGPQGKIPPTMPKSVKVPCNAPAKAIHLLGGVSGWGHPFGEKGSVSMIVRLHYEDGKTEDHELKNGIHFADYIRRVDVPESKFAFKLRDQQLRYLAIQPKTTNLIKEIEFVKGKDSSAPIVVAVTVEGNER